MSLWTRPEPESRDEDGPQGAEWLGHRDNCSLQWSARCNCNDPIEGEECGCLPPYADCDHPPE